MMKRMIMLRKLRWMMIMLWVIMSSGRKMMMLRTGC